MTAMDNPNKPGSGLHAGPDGVQPVEMLHLDDATVALVRRNVLVGGLPGSGKSGLLNGIVAHAALSALPVDGEPGDGQIRDGG
jgi:predicted ATP-dependent serine protease